MYAQRTMEEAVVQTSDKLNTQIATGEMWLLQQEIMNMCCDGTTLCISAVWR